MTSYVTAAPVEFPFTKTVVYDALCDLPRYPEWNTGMKEISATGSMTEGLEYDTLTAVTGYANRAHVKVERLVPNDEIELFSDTGVIHFRAYFKLLDLGDKRTEVICTLRFELHGPVMKLARPVIESMARTRVRTDLERLRGLLVAR